MKVLRSKWFLGAFCFVLGLGAALGLQRLMQKSREPRPPQRPAYAMRDMDSLFDEIYNDDFFGGSRDPFEQMRKMRSQMMKQFELPEEGSGLFDSWYRRKFGGGDAGEIKEREDKNFVYYDIAVKDLDKDKLDVKIADGQISISGRIEKKSDENGNASYFSSSFHRLFPVPPEVDANKVQIQQTNETLTLKFPKVG